ncbi:MAG: alpha-ketoglutarate-dependent dioxygenase AlkB [Acidimicrobiia bacterium]
MAADLTFQGTLDLAASADPFDTGFEHMTRTELDHGAWIDRQPGWVARPDGLFLAMLDGVDWHDGTEKIRGEEVPRPRQVASFGSEGVPAGLTVLRDMSAALSHRYGAMLDRITCNLYRDGQDSVAWHGDRIARERPSATVAIVSLGEPRPFRVRPKGGGNSIGWAAGRGDLIVMGGSCQRTYDHSVPKVAHAGPRIAVMFRHAYD